MAQCKQETGEWKIDNIGHDLLIISSFVNSYSIAVVSRLRYARRQPGIGWVKASFLTNIVSTRWLASVSLLAHISS